MTKGGGGGGGSGGSTGGSLTRPSLNISKGDDSLQQHLNGTSGWSDESDSEGGVGAGGVGGGFSDSEEEQDCPLCLEEMDESDCHFFPCPCGYQVKIFERLSYQQLIFRRFVDFVGIKFEKKAMRSVLLVVEFTLILT